MQTVSYGYFSSHVKFSIQSFPYQPTLLGLIKDGQSAANTKENILQDNCYCIKALGYNYLSSS